MSEAGNTRLEFSDEERHLVMIASEDKGIFLAPVLHMLEECLLCLDENDVQYVVGRLDDGTPFAEQAENPVRLQ